MLENTTTIKAESVDKAIQQGLAILNLTRDEVEVHVISEGKKGLFGFGKMDAIVEISAKNSLSLKEITRQLEVNLEEEKLATLPNKEDRREDVKVEEIVQDKEFSSPAKDQAIVEEEIIVSETVTNPEPQPSNQFDLDDSTSEYAEDLEEDEADLYEDSDENEEFNELSLDEACQQVSSYIVNVLDEYGAHSDVTFERNSNQIIFNIDTDKSGLVIGKHGKIINALQILSQTLLQSLNRRRFSVILNVGDYRDRRAGVLEQIAQRTADEVLKSRQRVTLDPLPAYERKQIHAYLARIDNIKTHSEGKEPNRYLVVDYDAYDY